MEKYQHMKAFIGCCLEYSKHRSEMTSTLLQRYLQILGVTSDMSIFDPGSCVATEFYVTLHELMSTLEPSSGLVWCAIGVLHHACRNPAARHALIHTYKFAPILTRLLGANLIQDKRVRVLQLLQELTYGVKISWQEAHLPCLISTLTSWIVSGEKDVISLSLGVLVNLCYKNLPAVYTLMRSVDSKEFLRTILKLQNDSTDTCVQVCKLLIILEHISGEIPDADIINFVNITFSTVGDAFKSSDVFLLRHMVDFFKDVQMNPHSRQVLLTYPRFHSDTEDLLLLLSETTAKAECVGMVFEFLQSLVTLKVTCLNRLYARFVTAAMQWVRTELACTQSLSLICSVTVDIRRADGDDGTVEVRQNILAQLEQDLSASAAMLMGSALFWGVTRRQVVIIYQHFRTTYRSHFQGSRSRASLDFLTLEDGTDTLSQNVLLLILNVRDNENYLTKPEARTAVTAVLRLLQEMSKIPSLRQKILLSLEQQMMQHVFQPLLVAEPRDRQNLFQVEVTELYVCALDFISDLATHDGQWLKLYSDLLQHKQVQMVLAIALDTGEEDVKRKVLLLTGTVGFPSESVSSLAKFLCDVKHPVLVPGGSKVSTGVGVQQYDMTPLFSLAQEGRLDNFLAKLQGSEIQDIPTSAIMELYEYKLAAMSRTERALQASLEAANNDATRLHHRLAQMSAEASRLYELLYHNQQCLEGLQQEKEASISRLEAAQIAAEEEHKRHVSEMKAKRRLLNELNDTIEEVKRTVATKEEELLLKEQHLDAMNKQIEELQSHLTLMEQKYKDQQSKNAELTKTLAKLEDRMVKRERIIEEKGNEIEKLQKVIQHLEVDLTNYKMLCKVQEKNLMEKEAEMTATQQQLSELQRMRDVIYEISGGKKKM